LELEFAFSLVKNEIQVALEFEESTYVASVFLPRVIYENVDIVFIGIYNKGDQIIGNQTGYRTIDQYRYLLAETMNCSKNKNV
jgi:hypothetical protein